MCLAVYMGCHHKVQPIPVPDKCLGIELATWKPAPLERFPYVYFFGQIWGVGPLNCSCLLAGHPVWQEDGGLAMDVDDTHNDEGPCPFDTLREYVLQAAEKSGDITLVCDDGGGVEQPGGREDYGHHVVEIDMIQRKSHLFVDPTNAFPWRMFDVVTR